MSASSPSWSPSSALATLTHSLVCPHHHQTPLKEVRVPDNRDFCLFRALAHMVPSTLGDSVGNLAY